MEYGHHIPWLSYMKTILSVLGKSHLYNSSELNSESDIVWFKGVFMAHTQEARALISQHKSSYTHYVTEKSMYKTEL